MKFRWLHLYLAFAVLLLAFSGFGASPAKAQQLAKEPDLAARLNESLKPFNQRLSTIERNLTEGNLDLERLTRLRTELEKIDGEILQRVVAVQPGFSDLTSRLDRLPKPPTEGEPAEPEEIATERQSLSDAKATTLLAIRDAELMTIRAGHLLAGVLDKRRELFISNLFEQHHLDAETLGVVRRDFDRYSGNIISTVYVWLRSLFLNNLGELSLVIGLVAAIGIILHSILRPLRRWLAQVEAGESVSYLQRVTLAFFTIVLPAAAAAVLATSTHLLLSQFGLYRLRIDQIMPEFLGVIASVFFVALLLRAVLSPSNGHQRLLSLSDAAARRLMWLGVVMAAIAGADYFVNRLIAIFNMPVEFPVINSALSSLLLAIILICIVTTRLNEPDPERPRRGFRGWNPIVYWLVWLSTFAIIIAQVAGYVSLGRFIAGQIIFTGSILATIYIGFLASRAIAVQGAMATTTLGRYLREKREFSDLRLDQIGLLLSILINILLLAIGIPVFLLQFGFQWDELTGWVASAVFGFNIGGVQISLGRIVVAMLVFFALIALTRLVQRWFDSKILARTQLDSGVKNSVKAGVGYIGFFLAAMVGISWAGFNLSNIALIAGALSVGIGFGLQNIVNNFVSGIIMLIERPIKVGDIIALAGTEGFVRKINVRATELETFDRQSVIIPNSEVINTSVGNWMHTDSIRRIIIGVGVAYGSDVEKVRELLLATLEGDNRVATFPPPFVYFADFGSSSLDFQLRFFIRDIMETPVVRNRYPLQDRQDVS